MKIVNKARFHYDNTYLLMPLKCGSVNVHQVGHLSCEPGYEVPRHRQDCFEFSLIVSGKAVFSICEEEYAVSKGDLICNFPGEYHAIFADETEPMEMLYLGFSIERSENAEQRYPQLENRLLALGERIVPRQDHLCEPFFRLLNELHQEMVYSAELTEAYVNELLVLACRSYWGGQPLEQNLPPLPDLTENTLVYDIISLLDSEMVYIGHLSSIGKKLGYNYSYLSQIFTKKVGMSLTDYFHLRLFITALEALNAGHSVTAVAEKLGYTSVSNFSRAFTNYFGMPPSRYRDVGARWVESSKLRLELVKSRVFRNPKTATQTDSLEGSDVL